MAKDFDDGDKAYEWTQVMNFLDEKGVPRCEGDDQPIMSLLGRIRRWQETHLISTEDYRKMPTEEEKAKFFERMNSAYASGNESES